MRLNVLPRPGPAQPPPQIIGRPSNVECLLDEAGQRAQEVERGAEAVEETAAVAAEEGKVAVAEGVGGAFGYLGGLAEGAAALAPTAGEVAGTLAGAAGVGAAATAGLAVGIAGGAASRHGLGAGEHALPAPAGQRGRGRAGRPVRQQHERRHSASALHAAHRQQHFRQPRKQPRLLAVRLPRAGAVQQHAAPLLLGPEPRGPAPVPELAGELQFRTPEPASAQL